MKRSFTVEIKENAAASSSSSSLLWVVLLIIACVVGYGVLNNTTKPAAHPVQTSSVQPAQSAPAGNYSIYSNKPSITADQINAILAAYHSPAAGTGEYLYKSAVNYGIDPIVPLAFFMHESTLGTQGEATATLALGNERCIPDRPCIDRDRGGYAQFNSWQDGYAHWFDLLTGPVYKGDGLTTIQQIIPRYAPSADNNNEQAYISSLLYCIQAWSAGKVRV
jgi:hypothetical protein